MDLNHLRNEIEEKRKMVREDMDRYIDIFVRSLKASSSEVEVTTDPEVVEKYRRDIQEDGGNSIVTFADSASVSPAILFFTGLEQEISTAMADHHISVILAEDIMPDVISAYRLALLKSIERGHGVIFGSSSASKTADIEGKLVWGAHGPKRFRVVVVR